MRSKGVAVFLAVFAIGSLLSLLPAQAGSLEDARAALDREDYAAAFQLVEPLAEAGDADAQFMVGLMHGERQVPPDYTSDWAIAHDWFLKAANQGQIDAMSYLGDAYDRGVKDRDGRTVVERNAERQAYWFGRAYEERKALAEAGDPDAQVALSEIYSYGEVPPDYRRDDAAAFAWRLKAARQGHAIAQVDLGSAYLQGVYLGLKKDQELAAFWFREAYQAGHVEGGFGLAETYRRGGRLSEAVKVLETIANRAAAKSSIRTRAAVELGDAFDDIAGEYWPESGMHAYFWYQIAMLNGAVPNETQERVNILRQERLTEGQVIAAVEAAQQWVAENEGSAN